MLDFQYLCIFLKKRIMQLFFATLYFAQFRPIFKTSSYPPRWLLATSLGQQSSPSLKITQVDSIWFLCLRHFFSNFSMRTDCNVHMSKTNCTANMLHEDCDQFSLYCTCLILFVPCHFLSTFPNNWQLRTFAVALLLGDEETGWSFNGEAPLKGQHFEVPS